METTRVRECLGADLDRLRQVAAGDLGAQVPTCPDWRMADLLRHVANVYLHKVESMRLGALPDPWPPPGRPEEEPLAMFDRAGAELLAEFDARPVSERAGHWYKPDQTVGCLLRRMAHETVIHRVDAELAAGEPVAPIPADLAVDGVDEVLVVVLGYLSHRWPVEFADLPRDRPGPAVRVQAGDHGWLLTPTPAGVEVTAGGEGDAAATVDGDPPAVLQWLWGRPARGVRVAGDPGTIARFQGLLREAAQ